MIHLKLTIMALLWAGGFIAGKNITDQAGPFTISFLRFFIATVVLATLVTITGQYQKVSRKIIGTGMIAAFFGVFCYNFLFFSGIKLVDAGRGAVIIGTVPVVVMIASCLLLKEKMSKSKVAGITLSLIGAWVVISNSDIRILMNKDIGWGEVYLIGSVLCAATFTLLSKKLLAVMKPLMTMVVIAAFGTIFLCVPALIEMAQQPIKAGGQSFIWNLMYLSIGPSVIAVTFYYDAIREVGPSRASQYMNLIPVFAVILAFVFLGEQLTASLLLGGGIVTTGLWLTNTT